MSDSWFEPSRVCWQCYGRAFLLVLKPSGEKHIVNAVRNIFNSGVGEYVYLLSIFNANLLFFLYNAKKIEKLLKVYA